MMAYVTVVIGVGDYTVYLQNYTEYDEHYNETTSVDPLYYTVAIDALKATQHRVDHKRHSQHSLMLNPYSLPATVQRLGNFANGKVDKADVQVDANERRQQYELQYRFGCGERLIRR
jgi:hypothetical protein